MRNWLNIKSIENFVLSQIILKKQNNTASMQLVISKECLSEREVRDASQQSNKFGELNLLQIQMIKMDVSFRISKHNK